MSLNVKEVEDNTNLIIEKNSFFGIEVCVLIKFHLLLILSITRFIGMFVKSEMLENFRMRRETFFVLVNYLRESLASDENAFIPGLSVEEKVAVAIYRLANVSEYRCTGNLFGYHKSTICEWLHRFVKVLISELSYKLIKFPKSRESCEVIAQNFEEKYGIPQVVEAIDGI